MTFLTISLLSLEIVQTLFTNFSINSRSSVLNNKTHMQLENHSSIKSLRPTRLLFQQLHPFISYSLHRSADFQRLDTEARATLQSIEDKARIVTEALAGQYETEAQRVLDEIRNVAAEEGVSQQATHFRQSLAPW